MTELSDEQVRRFASGCKDGTLLPTSYFMGQLAEDDLRLREELGEAERVRDGAFKEMDEVDQRLGKALDYPHYYLKDGKVVGPDVEGAVKDERVCTGDHVPGTLAAEAASRIDALRDQLEALREAVLRPLEDGRVYCCICDNTMTANEEGHHPECEMVDLPAAGRAHKEEQDDDVG